MVWRVRNLFENIFSFSLSRLSQVFFSFTWSDESFILQNRMPSPRLFRTASRLSVCGVKRVGREREEKLFFYIQIEITYLAMNLSPFALSWNGNVDYKKKSQKTHKLVKLICSVRLESSFGSDEREISLIRTHTALKLNCWSFQSDRATISSDSFPSAARQLVCFWLFFTTQRFTEQEFASLLFIFLATLLTRRGKFSQHFPHSYYHMHAERSFPTLKDNR